MLVYVCAERWYKKKGVNKVNGAKRWKSLIKLPEKKTEREREREREREIDR